MTLYWLASLRGYLERSTGGFDCAPAWLPDKEAGDVLRALYWADTLGTAPSVRPWTISIGGVRK